MRKLARSAVSGLVVVFAYLLSSNTATAAVSTLTDCQPNTVALDGWSASARLKINCKDGNWYYTNPGGSCATADIDMVKLWQSMAMSALLSGKKLNVYYDSACGNRTIVNMDVTN
jgi:hypothetical protein